MKIACGRPTLLVVGSVSTMPYFVPVIATRSYVHESASSLFYLSSSEKKKSQSLLTFLRYSSWILSAEPFFASLASTGSLTLCNNTTIPSGDNSSPLYSVLRYLGSAV